MSDESFKYPLRINCHLNHTEYAAWMEGCMQVLQGVMAWEIVMEEEATTRIGCRKLRPSTTHPTAIHLIGVPKCGISKRIECTLN